MYNLIKEGRKELKRWGLIFTCLASRAIHLETLNAMTTDSFLNALRRRREKVPELRSDQDINVLGARNELIAALKELDSARWQKDYCTFYKGGKNGPPRKDA